MPELRIDPIVGRRVYVAEDRAGRPNDYERQESAPIASRQNCCFCAGNEAQTPGAVATVFDAAGNWLVRVVPNKYPAVVLDNPIDGAFGAHEVIIESPQHLVDAVDLGADRLATVLGVYRDRLRHWGQDGRLKHAIVFKNSGFAAGASLEHIHSQLVALPYVPPAIQAEVDAVTSFWASQARCLYCELIEREVQANERVVVRNNGYVAICAYAARQPFETWILPEQHAAGFETLKDVELQNLTQVLHELLGRLGAVAPGAAYNLLLHTGPFAAPHQRFHWHWELVPRLTGEAGLEWGAGVHITPLLPERAAEMLRGAF